MFGAVDRPKNSKRSSINFLGDSLIIKNNREEVKLPMSFLIMDTSLRGRHILR